MKKSFKEAKTRHYQAPFDGKSQVKKRGHDLHRHDHFLARRWRSGHRVRQDRAHRLDVERRDDAA